MIRFTVESYVDADGVLRVAIPLGSEEAKQRVRVTVEPSPIGHSDQPEYIGWLRSIAGKWQGEFERPFQGIAEEREPF